MSNCLFDAFVVSLNELGIPLTRTQIDFYIYQGIKDAWQANPEGYTEIALAPHIIRTLARRYNLRTVIQHRVFSVQQARQVAWAERNWPTWLATWRWPDWGTAVEEFTLERAIYCQVSPSQHAYWRERPVSAGHFMAIQLSPKGE